MKLTEYIDIEKLRRHIAHGVVTARRHDTLPLTIYCYGKKAVFDQIWDDVTTKTRGLIVDDSDEIVARPYEKFFSLEQMQAIKQPVDVNHVDALYGPPTITEKVNGCLGIFWKYGIHWGIASKGSFHSPHAEFATKWMEKHVEEYGALVFPEGYTPIFEIICQEVQPHVIKYPEDGLVLLSFVNKETGEELNDAALTKYGMLNHHLKIVRLMDLTLEASLGMDSDRYEGLVATYNIPGKAPFKLKIKFPTFIVNRKRFYEEQRKQEKPNQDKYIEIFNHASTILRDALVSCTTKREFADFFNKSGNKEYSQICFTMLDEHDYKKAIWRLVEKRCQGR